MRNINNSSNNYKDNIQNNQKLSNQMNSIINNISSREGISHIASELINCLMNKEREIFLNEQLKSGNDNKANGYYNREINCNLGNLELLIPRDRNSLFRSAILPNHWSRSDSSYEEFINNLILNNYSPNKIKSLLKSMSLPYGVSDIEEIKEELLSKVRELKSREIDDNIFSIFIDAYQTKIKDENNKIKKAVIYSIISIDLFGKKELLGFYIFFGNETKEDWLVIFNDLINRGLKRLLLIISDDFSGLSDAIAALFPKTDHQLCYIHMQRNVRRNMSKNDAREFNNKLSLIRRQKDQEIALEQFNNLCNEDSYKHKYKSFINYLLKKKELYFNFMNYPENIRTHIYTTNIVENFNSRIEVKRINTGGYFQSEKTLDISMYIISYNLENNRWKKAIPSFKASEYEINQLFNLRFKKNSD